MYTLDLTTGNVTHDSDGHRVAPAQSDLDSDYQAYISWVNAGNQPTVITSVPPTTRKITKLAFRNRFTAEEKVILEIASLDNPGGTIQERQGAAAIRVYLKDLETAKFVDLDYPSIQQGVFWLASIGLLTMERANTILMSPIQPDETE